MRIIKLNREPNENEKGLTVPDGRVFDLFEVNENIHISDQDFLQMAEIDHGSLFYSATPGFTTLFTDLGEEGGGGSGGSIQWGDITGNIQAQGDLQNEFNTKVDKRAGSNYTTFLDNHVEDTNGVFDQKVLNTNGDTVTTLKIDKDSIIGSSSQVKLITASGGSSNLSGLDLENDSANITAGEHILKLTNQGSLTLDGIPIGGGGGSNTWGDITGNIQNQEDLQDEFNTKLSTEYTDEYGHAELKYSRGAILLGIEDPTKQNQAQIALTPNGLTQGSLPLVKIAGADEYGYIPGQRVTHDNTITITDEGELHVVGGGGGGSATWGDIVGNLADQTDLKGALLSKLDWYSEDPETLDNTSIDRDGGTLRITAENTSPGSDVLATQLQVKTTGLYQGNEPLLEVIGNDQPGVIPGKRVKHDETLTVTENGELHVTGSTASTFKGWNLPDIDIKGLIGNTVSIDKVEGMNIGDLVYGQYDTALITSFLDNNTVNVVVIGQGSNTNPTVHTLTEDISSSVKVGQVISYQTSLDIRTGDIVEDSPGSRFMCIGLTSQLELQMIYKAGSTPGSSSWGNIEGNIQDQQDLQEEFRTKVDKSAGTNYQTLLDNYVDNTNGVFEQKVVDTDKQIVTALKIDKDSITGKANQVRLANSTSSLELNTNSTDITVGEHVLQLDRDGSFTLDGAPIGVLTPEAILAVSMSTETVQVSIDESTGKLRWDVNGDVATVWGQITGDINNQQDLLNRLQAKLDVIKSAGDYSVKNTQDATSSTAYIQNFVSYQGQDIAGTKAVTTGTTGSISMMAGSHEVKLESTGGFTLDGVPIQGGGGDATWGYIGGNLDDQTDLKTVLDNTPKKRVNGSGSIYTGFDQTADEIRMKYSNSSGITNFVVLSDQHSELSGSGVVQIGQNNSAGQNQSYLKFQNPSFSSYSIDLNHGSNGFKLNDDYLNLVHSGHIFQLNKDGDLTLDGNPISGGGAGGSYISNGSYALVLNSNGEVVWSNEYTPADTN